MYRFIQNIGDYCNPGYFTDDFKDNVFKESGFDNDSLKELNKRFSDLRHQYYDVFKKEVIDGNLPMRYVLKKMHDFNTKLLQMLGYNTADPYVQWLYLDIDRVVPVRHIFRNGTQPQLLVMEMQPMLQMGDQPIEGLFDQYYESESEKEQRYRYTNWQNVTTLPIPEGCKISPKIINQAIEEIFYLPEEQRPKYVLVLAGSRIYLLEEKKFKHGSYLVLDIEELISEAAVSATKDYYTLFYLLCGREALANESQTALMDKLGEASTRNAFAVTKDLKEGVITAVESLANEAIYYIHNVLGNQQDETDEMFAQNVKDDCITIVYRLLFIFYAEARPELSILPMNDEVYLNGYSLDKLRDLETVQMQNQSTKDGYFIHDSLWRLFQMIHTGYNQEGTLKSFIVKKIDSPLFDDSKLKTLQGIKYRNSVWQKIIYALSISKPDGKRQPGRISYINLGINQLGSVYESLLAYRGFYAEQDYIEVFKAGAEKDGTFLVPASRMDDFEHDEIKWDDNGEVHTHKKGTFLYRLNGRDRQKSASYYTPEVLTQSTVKYTLKGFVDRLKDESDPFCATDLLNLKILEPAMGAAAFQNEVINQLAELYIQRREIELKKHVPPMERRNEVQKVKAYIATHNVYGVDLNPTAIELGKLSLWLNVIHKDMETPFFSNRLALGNAVIGAWLKVYSKDEYYGDKVANKKKLEPKSWWEKAPHKVKFFKNRVNRLSGEVYHFLLPDKNMLAVRNIKEQKQQHPDLVQGMNRKIKDWLEPIDYDGFCTLQRICRKIDWLLHDYYTFQRKLEKLTQNKMALWGVSGNYQMETFQAEKYEIKEQLNDTRYRHDNAYFKLKMVMDYWCALWFWEYEDAESLPTRKDFWDDIEQMLDVTEEQMNDHVRKALKHAYIDKTGQLGLFPEGHTNDMYMQEQYESGNVAAEDESTPETNEEESEIIQASTEEMLSEVQGKDRGFFDDSKRFKIAYKYAKRYHFFHPMLEFLEVFWLREGFDIICGNPPWINTAFDELGVISEKYPEVAIRKLTAPKVRLFKDEFFSSNQRLKAIYNAEETENTCSAVFMNSVQNYPLLVGQQTNLYKCVLTNGMEMMGKDGYMGLLTPEGIYEAPNGQSLRRELYKHLQYHFQYQNELRLFAEVDHHTMYGGQLLRKHTSSPPRFASLSNLFHPSTVDACFSHDGHGLCGGIKDENGDWNTSPHKDRVIIYGEKELRILAKAFGEEDDWESVKLNAIQSVGTIDILGKISNFPKHVRDYPQMILSNGLHETNSIDLGITKRDSIIPNIDRYELIYSGPHIYGANPLYKVPREKCILNSDYDNIDLTIIQEDFVPRTNYVPAIPSNEFCSMTNGFIIGQDIEGKPIYDRWIDYYKVAFKEFVGSTSERTINCAIILPKCTHINTLVTIVFKEQSLNIELAGLSSSIVMDFYFKTIGASHVTAGRIASFPLGIAEQYKPALFARTLLLNCLTSHYADLWSECWCDDFHEQMWTIDDPRLKSFKVLQKGWTWNTPLRNYFERRQALVEIDVITAMALGVSLQDLEMIYNIQFPVLQQNENDTWYDCKGNIVFTCSKGLTGVGVDRPVWEKIRSMKEGETYEHTIEKSELYKDQKVIYYAPFTKCDRIEDYRRAWAHFEKMFR
jgi:hypothetical protein